MRNIQFVSITLLVTPGISPFYGYLDPSSGSLLLLAIFGIFSTFLFLVKTFFFNLKNALFRRDNNAQNTTINNILIYSEGKNYSSTFRPLLQELENRTLQTEFWTSDEEDPLLHANWNYIHAIFIGKGNKAYLKLNHAKAKLCLMTTPCLDVLQIKRSPAVQEYWHVLHAPADVMLYNWFSFDYFDGIYTAGNYQDKHIRQLEERRKTQVKEFRLTGVPYYDSLAERIKTEKLIFPTTPCILIAPTWGEKGLLYHSKGSFIQRLLDSNIRVILRPHPQSMLVEANLIDSIVNKYKDNPHFSLDQNHDNLPSLCEASLMVSDFSSVIFDFAFLLERSIISVSSTLNRNQLEAFDLHDEEPWEMSVIPKIGWQIESQKLDELPTFIQTILESQDLLNEKIENIRKIKNDSLANFGNSSQILVNHIQEQLKNLDKE